MVYVHNFKYTVLVCFEIFGFVLAPEEVSGVYVSRFLMGVNMSKTRAPPSGANPSNLVEERIDTEDDVLHIQVFFPSLELRWLIVLDPIHLVDGSDHYR